MFLSFIDGPRWALMGLAVKLAQSVSPISFLMWLSRLKFAMRQVGLRRFLHTFAVTRSQHPISDRDSGKWSLGPEETQRRRSLMWELHTYDCWQVGFQQMG